jgi:hypothetical protein
VLVLIGVLSILGGVAEGLCVPAAVLVLVVLVLQLVALAAVRPFTTLVSFVHAAVTLSLTILSTTAQFVFSQVSATDTSGLWLLRASAACDLAVIGVTLVRAALDLSELFFAVRRRAVVLMSAGPRRRATTEMTNLAVLMQPLHEDAACDFAEDNLDSLVKNDVFDDAKDIADSEKGEEAADTEEIYWNADGTARVLPSVVDVADADRVVVDVLRAVRLVERPCDRDPYVDA